jgi:hypothetical protein
VDRVHVHVDLDVHDPSIAPANSYAAPDGLLPSEVHAVLRHLAERMPISSATLSAWDPGYDTEGRMRGVALDLLHLVADLARPVPVYRTASAAQCLGQLSLSFPISAVDRLNAECGTDFLCC